MWKSLAFLVLLLGVLYLCSDRSSAPVPTTHVQSDASSSDSTDSPDVDDSDDKSDSSDEADEPDSEPHIHSSWGGGHQAGYDWAEEHNITDESDCEEAGEHSNSPSFAEGCSAYVNGETPN